MSFINGIMASYEALKFLAKKPKVLPLALLPLLVGLVVGSLSLWLAFFILDFDSSTTRATFEWNLEIIWKILVSWTLIAWKIVQWIFLTVAFYLLGITLFCSFFYGLMVEKLEKILGLEAAETQSIEFLTQLKDGIKLLVFLVVGHSIILALHLLPLIGNLMAPLIGFAFQSFCIGMECFDFTLSMRGLVFQKKLQYCQSRLGWTLGNGSLTSFIMVIPLLNTCLLTLSIIGATFLHRRDRIRNIFQSVFSDGGENFVCFSDGNHILNRFDSEKMKAYLKDTHHLPRDGELLYIAQSKSGETILFTLSGFKSAVKIEAKEFLDEIYKTM